MIIKAIITLQTITFVLFGCVTKTIYLTPDEEISIKLEYDKCLKLYNQCEEDVDQLLNTIDGLDSCP